MLTILDVFGNVQANLETLEKTLPTLKSNPFYLIAKNQLDNALKSIEVGKKLNDNIDENDIAGG